MTDIRDTDGSILMQIEPGTEHAVITRLARIFNCFMVLDGEDMRDTANQAHLAGSIVLGRQVRKDLGIQ